MQPRNDRVLLREGRKPIFRPLGGKVTQPFRNKEVSLWLATCQSTCITSGIRECLNQTVTQRF